MPHVEGHQRRHGVTLVELLVSIVLLVLIASVVVPAVRGAAPAPPDSPRLRLEAARRTVLARGEATTIDWAGGTGSSMPVTIWPDGHVTADSTPGIEAMTGLPDTLSRRRTTTDTLRPDDR